MRDAEPEPTGRLSKLGFCFCFFDKDLRIYLWISTKKYEDGRPAWIFLSLGLMGTGPLACPQGLPTA